MPSAGQFLPAALLSELETKIRQKESDFALSLKALLKLHCQSCSKALYQQDLDRILLMTGTYLHGNVILLSRAVADCPSIDEVFSVLQDRIAALMPQSSPKLKQILRYIQTHRCV